MNKVFRPFVRQETSVWKAEGGEGGKLFLSYPFRGGEAQWGELRRGGVQRKELKVGN